MKALEDHHTKEREEIMNRYTVELTTLQKQLEEREEQEKVMKERLKQFENTIKNQQNTIDGQKLMLTKQRESLDKESLKSNQSSITPSISDKPDIKNPIEPDKLSEQKEISSNNVGDKRTIDEDKKQETKLGKQDAIKPNKDKNIEQPTIKPNEDKIKEQATIKPSEDKNKGQAVIQDMKNQPEVKRENLEAFRAALLKKQKEELELQRNKQQEEQRRLTRQLEQETKVKLQLKKQQILTDEQQQKILYCFKISIVMNDQFIINNIISLTLQKGRADSSKR